MRASRASVKTRGLLGAAAAAIALSGSASVGCSSAPAAGTPSGDAGPDSPSTSDADVEATSPADASSGVDSGPSADSAVPDSQPAPDAGPPGDAGVDGSARDAAVDGPASTPDGGTIVPPSCAPGGAGLTSCGAGGTESCCASLEVEGGTFDRTYVSDDAGSPAGEADPATVSGFRLDKYLVTVGRFRRFVDALRPDGGASSADAGLAWTPSAGSGKHAHLNGGAGLAGLDDDGGVAYEPGWSPSDDGEILPDGADADLMALAPYSTWTTSAGGGHESLPINSVSWAEAYAFCIWDGGFLPSESEWEYAAAGGSRQREYPWGSTAPGTGNAYAIYGCNYGFVPPACNDVRNFAPVGTAPLGAGVWGQLDLAGEVYEWTLDWYATAYPRPCTDCTNLSSASSARVTRGGDMGSSAPLLASAYRSSFNPTERSDIGFRCARTP